MTTHPLLEQNKLTDLDTATIKKTTTQNHSLRYTAKTRMKQYTLHTVLTQKKQGSDIHRTTTITDKTGKQINQKTQKIPYNQKLDRKTVKTIVNNYMTSQAHKELR